MSPKLILAGGLMLVVLALTTWGFYERSEKLEARSFIESAQAIAALQLQERKKQEEANAKRIQDAESALAAERLRHQADTHRMRSTINSITASQSGKVCIRSDAFTAFLSETSELIERGDIAISENKAWLASWPK